MALRAFGTEACCTNGRLDFAYSLAAEMMVASWPLLNGIMLLRRLASYKHAALLGQTSIVFQFIQLANPLMANHEVVCDGPFLRSVKQALAGSEKETTSVRWSTDFQLWQADGVPVS